MSRRGPVSPLSSPIDHRGVFRCAASGQIRHGGRRDPDVARMHVKRVDSSVAQLGDLGVPERRELVESTRTVNDPGSFRSQLAKRASDEFGVFRPRDADELTPGSRGIRERSQQVERRADAKLPPRRSRVLHRGVPGGREEERDVRLLERVSHAIGGRAQIHPERFEDIGAAALARDRAIAMFGDHDARASHDERRGGRDVEGVRSIAARAAGIEDRGDRARQRHGACAHRAGKTDHFLRPLAFERERHQESRDVRRLSLAIHDRAHGRGGLIGREVLVASQFFQQRREHGVSFPTSPESPKNSPTLAAPPASAPTRDGTARQRWGASRGGRP